MISTTWYIRVMKRLNYGFSLAELLVAMFVLVVGIAGVTSAIYWGIQNTDRGQHITQASNYARGLMESIQAQGMVRNAASAEHGAQPSAMPTSSGDFVDAPGDLTPIFDPPFQFLKDKYGVAESDATIDRYRRNIQVTQLANWGVSDSMGGDSASHLCNVVVTVWWTEDGTNYDKSVKVESVMPHDLTEPVGP